jgi:hypothetical protein
MCGRDNETTQIIHILEAIIALTSIVIGFLLLMQNRKRPEDSSEEPSHQSSQLRMLFIAFPQRILACLVHLWHRIQSLLSKIFCPLWQSIRNKIIPWLRQQLPSKKSTTKPSSNSHDE